MSSSVGKIRSANSLALAMLATLTASGCGGVTRPTRAPELLLQNRDAARTAHLEHTREGFARFLATVKAEHDDHAAKKRPDAPIVDVLIISGGGDWGAFGAGFLKGWGTIPESDPLARPRFDVVTGVSTGALIAPFAFIGTDESIERIVRLYRHPKRDWVKQRGPLYFLPSNASLAEVPGLERELRKNVTRETAAQIAETGRDGRLLSVNATNLDDAGPRPFDLVPEAKYAAETGDLTRLHRIMLAAAGIPGAFPYREIGGDMYVDGGVTGNLMYGGRLRDEDGLPAVWRQLYPGVSIPKIRYWVLFNNQRSAPPTDVPARWLPIMVRSVELSTRSASLTSIRHLHAMAEIARLKHSAAVEVRVVAIPDSWTPRQPGAFLKETMNDLADVGERMGADPTSWNTEPLS